MYSNELDEVCNQVEAKTYDDAFDRWNTLFSKPAIEDETFKV